MKRSIKGTSYCREADGRVITEQQYLPSIVSSQSLSLSYNRRTASRPVPSASRGSRIQGPGTPPHSPTTRKKGREKFTQPFSHHVPWPWYSPGLGFLLTLPACAWVCFRGARKKAISRIYDDEVEVSHAWLVLCIALPSYQYNVWGVTLVPSTLSHACYS